MRIVLLTLLAMLAFASNSLLCRLALTATTIDPASFTSLRLASGALALYLIMRFGQPPTAIAGSWLSAVFLAAYAIAFSYAYVELSAGTGALLLFAAVQVTMIAAGLAAGERLGVIAILGVALAVFGLVVLLLPGLTAPPASFAALMLLAGVAWGGYSLAGRSSARPLAATAGNFIRCLPLAAVLALVAAPWLRWDGIGAVYAVLSGAVTSGIGYAIWYAALPSLRATTAATVQLSVPAIAAIGGVLLLSEALSLRLLLASAAILGGIAAVIVSRR